MRVRALVAASIVLLAALVLVRPAPYLGPRYRPLELAMGRAGLSHFIIYLYSSFRLRRVDVRLSVGGQGHATRTSWVISDPKWGVIQLKYRLIGREYVNVIRVVAWTVGGVRYQISVQPRL